jgi:hypothetical protein
VSDTTEWLRTFFFFFFKIHFGASGFTGLCRTVSMLRVLLHLSARRPRLRTCTGCTTEIQAKMVSTNIFACKREGEPRLVSSATFEWLEDFKLQARERVHPGAEMLHHRACLGVGDRDAGAFARGLSRRTVWALFSGHSHSMRQRFWPTVDLVYSIICINDNLLDVLFPLNLSLLAER